MKAAYDGAEPSGNSVAAMNLLRLAGLSGNKKWNGSCNRKYRSFWGDIVELSAAMPLMLSAWIFKR